jgi:hypothetical protein
MRAILFAHNDPNRPNSVAKPTALTLHELSRTGALKAFGYELECSVRGV